MRQRINMDMERENISEQENIETECPEFIVRKTKNNALENQSNESNSNNQDMVDTDTEDELRQYPNEENYEMDQENDGDYYENEYEEVEHNEDEYEDDYEENRQYMARNTHKVTGKYRNIGNHSNDLPKRNNNRQPLPPNRTNLPEEKSRWDSINMVHWIIFNPYLHQKKGKDKMEIWNNEGTGTAKVRYNTENINEFISLGLTKTEKTSPFINARTGIATILSTFNKSMSESDLGAKMTGIVSHIEQGRGLAQTLDIYKKHEKLMTELAMDFKEKDLLNAFPDEAFENIAVAEIVQGWNLANETSYTEFAKDKNLDLNPLMSDLNVHVEVKVDVALRDKERTAKKEMLNCITSLHLLDLLGEKIDNLPEKN